MQTSEPRRHAPRLVTEGLCGVVSERTYQYAAMLDLSSLGIRLERPFDRRTASRTHQLEIELPGVDEIVWAKGHVTYAHLSPMGGRHADGQPKLWCRAGIEIDGVAARDRRLIHDYVVEARRAAADLAAAERVIAELSAL